MFPECAEYAFSALREPRVISECAQSVHSSTVYPECAQSVLRLSWTILDHLRPSSTKSNQLGSSHLGQSVTIPNNLRPFLTIQDYPWPSGTISDISDHLGPSLKIWDHIRLSVHHVPPPPTIWDHLGQSATIWDHLSLSGTLSLQLRSSHPISISTIYQVIWPDNPPTLSQSLSFEGSPFQLSPQFSLLRIYVSVIILIKMALISTKVAKIVQIHTHAQVQIR